MRINKYKLTLSIFVLAFVVAIAIFSLLLYSNGPRVRLISYDADPKSNTLVQNTTMTITFDRPLQPKDYTKQIQISPKVAFTTQTSAQAIKLTFQENLLHGTDYTLNLGPNVYDQAGKQMRSTFQKTIHTGLPAYAYLERNYDHANDSGEYSSENAEDHIKIAQIGAEPETVFSHPEITMFAINRDFLVVAASGEDEDELYTIDLKSRKVRQETIQFGGMISNLSLSPRGKFALFTVSPDFDSVSRGFYERFANRVESLNLESGDMLTLTNPKGEYLKAFSIHTDTYGQIALIQDAKQSFYAASPFNDNDPVLIGSYTSTFGFDDSAGEIIFRDNVDFARYDISSSETKSFAIDTKGYAQSIIARSGDIYISSLEYLKGKSQSYVNVLDSWDDSEPIEIWSSPVGANETLNDFSLTYDGSLIALQLNPDNCKFDQVGLNSQCRDVHTKIYDINSKETIGDFKGFDIVWLP